MKSEFEGLIKNILQRQSFIKNRIISRYPAVDAVVKVRLNAPEETFKNKSSGILKKILLSRFMSI